MPIPLIHCATHGRQPQTLVCVHVIEGLRVGEPTGFWWSRGDGGELDALCDACNALDQAAFDALGPSNIAPLCMGCFEDAAVLNGVEIA